MPIGSRCGVCSRLHSSVYYFFEASGRDALLQAKETGCLACSIITQAISYFSGNRTNDIEYSLEPNGLMNCCYNVQGADVSAFEIKFFVDSDEIINLLCASFPIENHRTWWRTLDTSTTHLFVNGLNSPQLFQKLQPCLAACEEEHPLCSTSAESLPKRVLDVSQIHKSFAKCRLYETCGEKGYYMTLSHCWGRNPAIIPTTTKATLASRLCEINVLSLPKTFQDAITVAHKLGIRYLWIDSLCIVQDDPADWARESANMCNIYSKSYLTLAATASANGLGGFFPARDPSMCDFKTPVTLMGKTYYVYARRKRRHRTLDSTEGGLDPLSTRAWAFQERLLSRRILHFTSEELVWECTTRRTCECEMMDREFDDIVIKTVFEKMRFLDPLLELSATGHDTSAQWNTIVFGYTKQKLTKNMDKLPALSGVASLLVEEGNYLAGLRKDRLILDLTWRALTPMRRPSSYCAPTWSWASVDGGVAHEPVEYEHSTAPLTQSFTLNSAECVLATSDPFGRVSSGQMTLWAPFVKAIVLKDANESQTQREVRDHESDYNLTIGGDKTPFYPDVLGSYLENPMDVHCLVIWNLWAYMGSDKFFMVVRKVDNDRDEYERVGCCRTNLISKVVESGTFTII